MQQLGMKCELLRNRKRVIHLCSDHVCRINGIHSGLEFLSRLRYGSSDGRCAPGHFIPFPSISSRPDVVATYGRQFCSLEFVFISRDTLNNNLTLFPAPFSLLVNSSSSRGLPAARIGGGGRRMGLKWVLPVGRLTPGKFLVFSQSRIDPSWSGQKILSLQFLFFEAPRRRDLSPFTTSLETIILLQKFSLRCRTRARRVVGGRALK